MRTNSHHVGSGCGFDSDIDSTAGSYCLTCGAGNAQKLRHQDLCYEVPADDVA